MNTLRRSTLPERLQAVIASLYHPNTGVINELIEMPLQADEPPLYMFHARCSSPLFVDANAYLLTEHHGEVLASGCSPERTTALWSTIGEAVERYACACWAEFSDDFLEATVHELGSLSLDIGSLILYRDESYSKLDFPYRPLELNEKYRWFAGRCLRSGQTKYIPSAMLWHGYVALSDRERFCPQISTGVAAGQSTNSAIVNGIREVIERDAFSTYWLTKQQPPRIKLSKALRQVLSDFSTLVLTDSNFVISLFWLTNDVDVPVVMCTIEGKYNEGFALGAACHLDPVKAIEKSIHEAFHTWNWMLDMQRSNRPIPAREQVAQFADHVRYFTEQGNRQSMHFLTGQSVIDIPRAYFDEARDTDADNPSTYVNRLYENIDVSSYCAYITPQAFSQLDLHVAKVICPGVQPLHCGFGNEHSDPRRLEKFAKWCGLDNWTLNTEPHPFP